MLASLDPVAPVYCVHPGRLATAADEFLTGFPGRVLYAIKANNDPVVLDALYAAGIRHFDCASLREIEAVTPKYPDATSYFMSPVRFPGDAGAAFNDHGVRHFMVDSVAAVAALVREIDADRCVIFARMAVSHESAIEDLSSKFGATPGEIPELLETIRANGAEPALAFNVGSGVRSPGAYEYAMGVAAETLAEIPYPIRLIDIGGGFPRPYPGFDVPPLAEFFAGIRRAMGALPLADVGELLAEPGRSLCATGMSTVVRVLLRKRDRLYINDGMYGAFWELRFDGHKQYPVAAYRNAERLRGDDDDYLVFGPTCDSTDRLPERVALPRDIAVGDHIVFDHTGAYSLSGRTDFNGFHSGAVVSITP